MQQHAHKQKRATIVHLRDSNFVGGPERQILEHFKRMDPERYNMVLVCYENAGETNELRARAQDMGFQCLALPVRSPFNPKGITDISDLLRNLQADVLVTHGHKGNIFGRIACWMQSVPTIAVSRGWTMESLKIRFFEFLDKVFLLFANHVVAVSHGQEKKIRAIGVNPGRLSVIHNSIDTTKWESVKVRDIRAELGVPADGVLVVSAGRLSPEKDQISIVRAAKEVLSQLDNVYFAVFGEGVLRGELEAACAEAGVQDHFFLPGFCPDMVSVMHAADIFVLPSLTEGLPNVVLEAFACAKPVVATAVGGVPELVSDGENGFLVEVRDVRALADRLASLARDGKAREQFGLAGKKMVARNFTYSEQAARYEDLYESILGSRESAGA